MQKLKIILFLFIVGGFTVSCGEDFLTTSPTQDIDDSAVTSSPDNMMLGLNGIHREMYTRRGCQGCVGQSALMIFNDALGEDFVLTNPNSTWFYSQYRWTAHRNANARDTIWPWEFYYELIRNANVIIHGEERVASNPEFTQDEINIPIGQSYAYRAFFHFNLVQMYAERYDESGGNSQMGVPYMTEVVNEGKARDSVEDVYAMIHQDLDEAISRLEHYVRPNKSHFDASVVKGLKARVYLTQGNWEMAAQYASEAREGTELMTQDEYTSGFNDYNNREWMWASHVSADQSDRFGNFGAQVSRNNSTTFIRTTPIAINITLYYSFPQSDVRLANFDPTGEHEDLNLGSNFTRRPYTSQKFIAPSVNDSHIDVPYLRAAELYLTEAEARANMGDDGRAAQVLYELVSARDDQYTLSSNTGDDLLEEIYLNRRLELWGEGFRFFDLKRLNLPLDRTGANHNPTAANNFLEVEAGDKMWQYLIPEVEMHANPLMEQNPL